MLVDEPDFEGRLELLVEDFHRLERAARQDQAQRLLFFVVQDLLEDVARVQTEDAPLSDVLFFRAAGSRRTFVCFDEKFEVLELYRSVLALSPIFCHKPLDFADFLKHVDDAAEL